jgi:hypothetical protein
LPLGAQFPIACARPSQQLSSLHFPRLIRSIAHERGFNMPEQNYERGLFIELVKLRAPDRARELDDFLSLDFIPMLVE